MRNGRSFLGDEACCSDAFALRIVGREDARQRRAPASRIGREDAFLDGDEIGRASCRERV